MAALQQYASELHAHVMRGDGKNTAKMLRVDSVGMREVALRSRGVDVKSAVSDALDKQWAIVLSGCVEYVSSIERGALEEAAASFTKTIKPVTALFKADAQSPSRGPFWVFVVRAMAANTRLVGSRCDQAAAAAGQPTKYNSEMFNNLRELFRIFQHEPEDSVRRRATLAVSAEHLRVAFNMNKINLGFVHLSTMDRSDSPALRSDLVTFHYYRGRLLMFNDDYEGARQSLQTAYDNCPREVARNRELIIKYLVPINMLQGRMPSAAVLRHPGMAPYAEVAAAVRAGHVGAFEEAVERHLPQLIRDGTYFLVEKLKALAYRRLVQRVQALHSEILGPDANEAERWRIPLQMLVRALEVTGVQADMDEIECVLANLRYQGTVSGVLSHGQRMLALSKVNAFPSLTPSA